MSVEPIVLLTLRQVERLGQKRELLEMTPGDHAMGLYREKLRGYGMLRSGKFATRRDGQIVLVAGRVVVR